VTADDTETVAFTLENFHVLETQFPHLARHLHTYIIEMLAGSIKRQVGTSDCMLQLAQEPEYSHLIWVVACLAYSRWHAQGHEISLLLATYDDPKHSSRQMAEAEDSVEDMLDRIDTPDE
jgi:hypothetical protein